MTKAQIRSSINIMFTCIGRRVSLLKSFAKAAKQVGKKPCIIGTDTTPLSPALQLCDKRFIVKPVRHRDYLKQLLDIAEKNKVHLLIPTVDLDLKILSKNRGKFEKIGCFVNVSAPEVIDICQDKRKTFSFLKKNGFDTPETILVRTALARKKLSYPKFLKPWDGYASRGTAVVENRKELEVFAKRIPNCIVQEYVQGAEYTCDVFVGLDMKARCVVPRKRIEVRSGEVSKGMVVKNREIMAQTAKVTEALGAGPGVITIQLILKANDEIDFIEINPRFGGGAPLSIKAGANFPKWILQQLMGKEARINFNGFKQGLTMLRYDNEVWLTE